MSPNASIKSVSKCSITSQIRIQQKELFTFFIARLTRDGPTGPTPKPPLQALNTTTHTHIPSMRSPAASELYTAKGLTAAKHGSWHGTLRNHRPNAAEAGSLRPSQDLHTALAAALPDGYCHRPRRRPRRRHHTRAIPSPQCYTCLLPLITLNGSSRSGRLSRSA